MFLRVGLQAENNVLDRMRYHFSGLKGIKMANLASLSERYFILSYIPCINSDRQVNK